MLKRSGGAGVTYVHVRVGSNLISGSESEQVRAFFGLHSRAVPVQALVIGSGYTGMADHPDLQHDLKAAERGLVSEIVVSEPSRLTRSRSKLARLLCRFDRLGVRLSFGR